MISIYTRTNSLLSAEYWKRTVKEMLRRTSGPDAVLLSLLRGLDEIREPYELNPHSPSGNTVIVLSGKRALKDAIVAKKTGEIKHLVAGPNICVSPNDNGSLICSPEIDLILVPSGWVRNLWVRLSPEIAQRIAVWAAGVAHAITSSHNGPVIIYDKLTTPEQAKSISLFLSTQGVPSVILNYGNFNQTDFFNLLGKATALIYLSLSESQGLALQEAWARDVPTFVQYSGEYHANTLLWKDPKINAPYLSDELGSFFSTNDQLLPLINNSRNYHPQIYCAEHFSDSICAKNLLALL